jgi:hypothetical protein
MGKLHCKWFAGSKLNDGWQLTCSPILKRMMVDGSSPSDELALEAAQWMRDRVTGASTSLTPVAKSKADSETNVFI